ncbi:MULTISPECIES: FAD-dependent oxidoreductase [Cyanophyceae]|uniref:FAD-dependent oxidoreductase n=1 Tax=Cyanophyceae TaxID=3028117 RepID=UPI0016822211|nr:FAD-dependent oxidoreductase [Trichocoleus sp. FACHB-69]MBD1935287.1 FAD-dependent oxidoreductase [Trichocoleus sp. FACHB-69]
MSKIAVIGAGPAGCSAGYHLAKSGHQVTLIDKESFPRDKICGDGVSLQSVQALSTMGIYPQDIKRKVSEFTPINGLVLGVSNGNYHMQTTELEGYCIPRFVFDNLLYERAINAGCVPSTQRISNIDRHHQELHNDFDFIIDARGVYAGDANAIAIRAYWIVKSEDFPQAYLSLAQIYFDKSLGVNGYGWIFPVDIKAGLVKLNVGVGIWIDEYKKMNKNIIRIFDEFVQRNEQMKELLSKIVSKQKPKAYPLATALKGNRVSDGKILKIGDAANLTDPLTGEGIANAILSGLHVTQAINMSSSPEKTAENWQRLYETCFEEDIRAALRIKSLRKYSFMNNMLVWLMKRNQHFSEQVTYAIVGSVPYNELLPSLKH